MWHTAILALAIIIGLCLLMNIGKRGGGSPNGGE